MILEIIFLRRCFNEEIKKVLIQTQHDFLRGKIHQTLGLFKQKK